MFVFVVFFSIFYFLSMQCYLISLVVGVTPQGGMFCFSAPPNDGMPQQPQVVFPTYSTPVQGHEQPDQQYLHSEGPSQRPVQLPVHGATVHSPGGYIFPGAHFKIGSKVL